MVLLWNLEEFVMKRLFIVLLFVVIAAVPSFSQQKHALVIGNSNYNGITGLNNPVNDANDMETALKSLGFNVEKVLDGNLERMETAVENLRRSLSGSRNSYGFFFYAGHGVQANGLNYLIPVEAGNIRSETHLRERAVSMQYILESMNEAGNELNMIVLDACRDNPFGWSRSGSRGLSLVSGAPSGSIIMYATGANSTADDGSERNGLFTGHLLNNLRNQGLNVFEVFDKTMDAVNKATNGRQHPELSLRFAGATSAFLGSRPANAPVSSVSAATNNNAAIREPIVTITPGVTPSKPVQTPTSRLVYLESNIKEESSSGNRVLLMARGSGASRYPEDGSFSMGGKSYFRGIASSSSSDSSFKYNIAGQGFTRLTGIFGRVSDGRRGGTITISGDGVFLGGFEVSATGAPVSIDAAIPSHTQQIVIKLQPGLGFGDAAFSDGVSQQSPTHPLPPTGAAYLESNIKSASSTGNRTVFVANVSGGSSRYPEDGSFSMGGKSYFRGITSSSSSDSSFTYNIAGQGFTRLTGIFGRASDGRRGGTITITADGVLLGGKEVSATGAPISIDVAIPSRTQQIVIRLQPGLGFGDALFSR